MSKALSVDLRERVVRAVAAGVSCRAAAVRFGVSASSAIRWCARLRATGSVVPGALGGDRRARGTDPGTGGAHARPHARGTPGGPGRVRGRRRQDKPVASAQPAPADAQKKTAHAAEQSRPDVLTRRWAWFEGQPDLEPES